MPAPGSAGTPGEIAGGRADQPDAGMGSKEVKGIVLHVVDRLVDQATPRDARRDISDNRSW